MAGVERELKNNAPESSSNRIVRHRQNKVHVKTVGERSYKMRVLQGHTSGIATVAFSPDGTRSLTASWDHTARVWEVETGQEISTLTGHTDQLSGAAFSADGSRIL